jgi:phosphate transport system permease protein
VSAADPRQLALADDVPIDIAVSRGRSDRAYRGVSYVAGSTTLALMALIGLFLVLRGWPAMHYMGWSFFTEARWEPTPAGGVFGVAALLLGTAIIAVVALALSVPIAIGTALFITEFAPSWMRKPLTSLVDLLAAVPSLIYGIWGAAVLQPKEVYFSRFLAAHVGWFPGFHTTSVTGSGPTNLADFASSGFLAGIVVALMILPISAAVMREVFSQAPAGEKEGALALGGTRWGVIRDVVLPFGRGGIIGGSMLGLGRALGETIAVAIIVSRSTKVGDLLQVLKTGGNSIAANIARTWAESGPGIPTSALMAAGLVLFVVTLIVNAGAGFVVGRSRSGAATEI